MSRKILTHQERLDAKAAKARKWRQKNPGYGNIYKTRYRESGKAKLRMRKQKSLLVSVFGGACQCCGGVFHHSEFDFHHLDKATKERPLQPDRSWATLAEEAQKCIMLCANCHRLYHFFERNQQCLSLAGCPHITRLQQIYAGDIWRPTLAEILKASSLLDDPERIY